MKKRLRYKIRVQETREDYVWIEAYSWIEAERKALQLTDLCLELDPITGGREVEWTEDIEEIK
ncbi:MAG: hypothetical protein GY774_15400 [Planctomycetes bacterium]|nr:hypothetical protein [Planctomycetota bacterium]